MLHYNGNDRSFCSRYYGRTDSHGRIFRYAYGRVVKKAHYQAGSHCAFSCSNSYSWQRRLLSTAHSITGNVLFIAAVSDLFKIAIGDIVVCIAVYYNSISAVRICSSLDGAVCGSFMGKYLSAAYVQYLILIICS